LGREPDEADQGKEVDLAAGRDDAAYEHGGLTRRDQTDECGGLEEGECGDRRIRPGAERLRGILERPLDVRHGHDPDHEQQRGRRQGTQGAGGEQAALGSVGGGPVHC
jgi:hypothetical protein